MPRDFIHVDRMWGVRLRIHEREEDGNERQMNVYDITWLCVELQEVRLVKINHSHKFKTYRASSEAIPKAARLLGREPYDIIHCRIVCKINKEGKYTETPAAPCESVESARARNRRRLSNRGTRRTCKKKIEKNYDALIKRRSALRRK